MIAMTLASTGHLLFEKNRDFLSMSSMIRSLLLERTMKSVLACNSAFIAHRYQICGDLILINLIVTITTFSYFCLITDDREHWSITKEIQKLQDVYIHLAWRYMLFKYDHRRAVRSFSELLRALFALPVSINSAVELPVCHQMVDSLVERIEQSLHIHSQDWVKPSISSRKPIWTPFTTQ